MHQKLRTLSAITVGSLALTAAAISVSSGASQAPAHAVLAARVESVPAAKSAGIPPGQLNPGQEITSGTQIASPDGKFVLQMQSDGNLVLRAPGNIPIGDTRTAGHDGTIAVMQTDGNFVLRAPGNIPIWASGTDGHPGTVLQVQDDGGVVLYAPGHQVLRVLFPASTPATVPAPATNGASTPGAVTPPTSSPPGNSSASDPSSGSVSTPSLGASTGAPASGTPTSSGGSSGSSGGDSGITGFLDSLGSSDYEVGTGAGCGVAAFGAGALTSELGPFAVIPAVGTGVACEVLAAIPPAG